MPSVILPGKEEAEELGWGIDFAGGRTIFEHGFKPSMFLLVEAEADSGEVALSCQNKSCPGADFRSAMQIVSLCAPP